MRPLYGEIDVSGAKNAAVAIIPAALMVNGVCRLENIPQISDADMLMTILEHLGAKIRMVNRNTVEIDCTDVLLLPVTPVQASPQVLVIWLLL